MLNLTLLSFTIASSFQKSPFLHLSSSTKKSVCILKDINAHHIFSSFLITQSFNSFSIIEGSTFNRFITSLPILSFRLKETEKRISNQTFYGDTIPSNQNIFYNSDYNEIINCKFMSILDNNNEQSLDGGGLCIYSTRSTKVDSCYFFAILSRRSGSAILFDQESEYNYEYVESKVVNCMFKSITQKIIEEYFDDEEYHFYCGGVISYGNFRYIKGVLYRTNILESLTDNCFFDNINSISDAYTIAQLGMVTYASVLIKSKNLNFTNNKLDGSMIDYGIISIISSSSSDYSFSFINFLKCIYDLYGVFTVDLSTHMKQKFSLDFSNFINNSYLFYGFYPQFIIQKNSFAEVNLIFKNIQCNFNGPFLTANFGNEEPRNPFIYVSVFNSLFSCSFDNFLYKYNKEFIIFDQSSENNIFGYSDFIVDVTNNIVSNFGFIKTSQFTVSYTFSNTFIPNSASYFDFYFYMPDTIEIIAYTIGAIAIISFIIFLCSDSMKRKINIEQFEQLNFDNEIEIPTNAVIKSDFLESKNEEQSSFINDKKETESELNCNKNEL